MYYYIVNFENWNYWEYILLKSKLENFKTAKTKINYLKDKKIDYVIFDKKSDMDSFLNAYAITFKSKEFYY